MKVFRDAQGRLIQTYKLRTDSKGVYVKRFGMRGRIQEENITKTIIQYTITHYEAAP